MRVVLSSLIMSVERVLLTIVSRTLITQAMLSYTPRMRLVRVTVHATASVSTVTSMAVGLVHARVMPCISIDVILQDAILVHSQAIAFESLLLVPILIVVVILITI